MTLPSITILPESVAVGITSTAVGFIMSDAMWALLVAQIGTIAIMIIKDHRDKTNREQDRLDRESDAKLLAASLAKVGGEREERIVAKVEAVEKAVVAKTEPQKVEVVNTPEHPVPVKEP